MSEFDSDMTSKHESSKVNVMLVAPILPIVGGHTVQANRLLEKFSGSSEVELRLQPINPSFLPSLQRVKYVRTLITWPKYVLDLLLNVRKFDVVHIFSASYLSFLLSPTPALIISRLFGKPTILNYRSGEAEDHLRRWRTAIPTIRSFDKIVVPSDYLVDVFADFGIEATSVFNFVDSERFPFRRRKPLKPIFLSNRNFEAHYNVACTLRAFKLIQTQFPGSKLIVVGDGPERHNLEELARSLQISSVEFRGAVRPEAMAAVYDEADIFLNSSSIDNMPNSIIEAFSAGLPVVSTNAGGIPYIVENGRLGLLVEKNDHEEIAANALRLLSDDALAQRLIAAARESVKQYTWEEVSGKWTDLYMGLAKKKH